MGSPDDGPIGPAMDIAKPGVAGGAGIDRAARADQHVIRMRESLDTEMLGVKDGVLRMGAYVEEQILAALDAITHRANGTRARLRPVVRTAF